ncbi:hypothetical protein NMY22_g12558 [Coprinellus aureogranulatus]|nr:hypothetical protein NMY22_g12558 [Coprinellus aureogranulatus]
MKNFGARSGISNASNSGVDGDDEDCTVTWSGVMHKAPASVAFALALTMAFFYFNMSSIQAALLGDVALRGAMNCGAQQSVPSPHTALEVEDTGQNGLLIGSHGDSQSGRTDWMRKNGDETNSSYRYPADAQEGRRNTGGLCITVYALITQVTARNASFEARREPAQPRMDIPSHTHPC